MLIADSLYRFVRLFREAPSFTVTNQVAEFPKRPDIDFYEPEPDYDGLAKRYGVEHKGFTEKVANLTNPEDLKDGNELEINWVTSVDVLASRTGYFEENPFFQLAAIGIVRTGDRNVLVGVRGGDITPERVDRFASGLYGCPPGGSVLFEHDYGDTDPITHTLKEEMEEELGDFYIDGQRLLGVFEAFKPGPTGYKFVSVLETDATLAEIQEMNVLANRAYDEVIGKGGSKEDASKALKEDGLPPDAWEHPIILGCPDNRGAIEYWVNSQPQAFSGIGAGALMLYALSLPENE